MSSLSSGAAGSGLITPSTRIDGGSPATRYKSLPDWARSISSQSASGAGRLLCRIADEFSSFTSRSRERSSSTVSAPTLDWTLALEHQSALGHLGNIAGVPGSTGSDEPLRNLVAKNRTVERGAGAQRQRRCEHLAVSGKKVARHDAERLSIGKRV